MREFLMMAEGYKRVHYEWLSILRWQTYVLTSIQVEKGKMPTLYEFMPLVGDPSAKELKEMQKQRDEEEKAKFEDIRALYKQLGFLQSNN